MITAIVLYDLPESIGRRECLEHFTRIAPDFLTIPGFIRKQFIYKPEGGVAGGAYTWESREAAERFYSGEWPDGIRARYGSEATITYFDTLALADKETGRAGEVE